ncbi:arsenate reductase [Hufsiella ginkgonis]|uniref:Spx/MgsR family RNA polymerase-binding regulatory protein n=1 Tax=Hufsiella ginkgonis TaxID=2695274 RepID=A0A7K1XS56_9SPHI|nr:arsenate reductase [Hufsiella ginkgonis]MXV13815.1 Spx/MgsR family RNA polymerase-binding regulatory protein [Hufsiella ginkgonis]
MKVYGIPNCDTVQKALTWLKSNQMDPGFHDYKKLGISEEKLKEWIDKVGWEILVNKKSTTWRALTPEEQAKVTTAADAIRLMQAHNSVIKRPVIEFGDKITVGFNEKAYQESFL